ncbi:MarR family winged helix-turn-helix transcriptional regulator [Streptomyces griseus]|uniref:MarR family winged helix-turn-helix transcriptional regulator n=1 Tax=Streptomyces TaxID=1883 RepID=UPI0005A9415E|nr:MULTISPECIES: MarR family winged helix-turn-helix transcriptional regulator [Streptomyces]MYT82521.1 MarR family transcriptional regulator [Streptomyces sp. SID8364]MBW3702629.1 MarR family transcriptional regulator [Streptomyces griseus]NEB53310.1 winged helix-turn-helix transcriptional regulator [Streptomyces griseus]SBV02622.1 DNA-binding transcriptional regulator, MarR family [Streptomyces sp. MnatMP-M77]SED83279.1 DNA-binding transcriptional regulator, MarR family [Streptomyces griseus
MPSTTTNHTSAAYFPRLAAERLDIALCRASAAVARAADARAGALGLGVGQHLVLKMLAEVGPSSQRVLSDELRIDRSVMVGICDSLEQAGHVRRERDAADRRAYAVTITDPGRQLLAQAEEAVPEFLDGTFQALSPAERRQLSGILGKLL